MVPTFNEEDNVLQVYKAITDVMENDLKRYEHEIIFIDNCSVDNTRSLIEALCEKDKRVKAIFNARNFGYSRSHFYGLTQCQGDAVMLIHADLQNPPSLMPKFVEAWEEGYKVIIGIKDQSKENQFMFFLRSCYYKLMNKISEVKQIEHFTDFELLDKSFVDVLRKIDDPMPYLRGIICELGFKMKEVHYIQNKRERGKSWANFWGLYDFAMQGITSYSKALMRMATFVGAGVALCSIVVSVLIFLNKIFNWSAFNTGIAAIGVGVFFLGAVQIFFIGIVGEYILSINTRVLHRPLVIEERRINFVKQDNN